MRSMYLSKSELEENDNIVYLVPGHAPSMVVTRSPFGNINVATFEQTMLVSYQPPRILLAINEESDTYKNIMDGSDAIIGFPRIEYIQQVYDGGVKVPRSKSELEVISGITTSESHISYLPSIDQCWINMECRLKSDVNVGDHNMVLMDITGLSLDEDVWDDDQIKRRNSLPSVYYTTSGNFFTPGEFKKVSLSKNLEKYKNAD